MSKTEITLEQAMEATQISKDAVKAAKAELKAFRKQHNLKPDDSIEDEKLAKQLTKLTNKLSKAEEELAAAQETAKSLQPVKARITSYEYPEDCVTAADKKKYRAKKRREKKAAEKAANAGEAGEAPVKQKKSKAPVEETQEAVDEEPTTKKKRKTVAEDED